MDASRSPSPAAWPGEPAATTPSSPTRRVVLRADATPTIGVGHAMRLLALAQELRGRGIEVHLAGDLDVAWVASAYAEAGVLVHPCPTDPDDLVTLVLDLDARWCVLDRYDLGPRWGVWLRRAGVVVMAMVDGPFSADQDADLYVDQNPGATPRAVGAGQLALAGADYTLFRDDVLALRRPVGDVAVEDVADEEQRPLRVLEVFGGTDPCGAAPVVTPLVLQACSGLAADITVVTPDPTWVAPLAADAPPGVELRASGPVSDLAARAAASDLVVTASGSSVWELMCLGVPLGVVCVIDNQRPGYDMVADADLALGLGDLEMLRRDDDARAAAVSALREAFTDRDVRVERAARAQELLDGRGRARVAEALVSLAR